MYGDFDPTTPASWHAKRTTGIWSDTVNQVSLPFSVVAENGAVLDIEKPELGGDPRYRLFGGELRFSGRGRGLRMRVLVDVDGDAEPRLVTLGMSPAGRIPLRVDESRYLGAAHAVLRALEHAVRSELRREDHSETGEMPALV
jgi:hypothetical protein